ncbi:MAG: hypothetical protein LKJ13_08655 [Clostridia bacterium]|jgi:uncharacterized membrane protein YbhN (UPF0104 family)|nr:hypothetical protein [Clostridia bacterium]MCI1999446.1 hypothetical protein [Clostridia bacterium]MCI2015052.1 hypothetical protein [Clostridia bacterium]
MINKENCKKIVSVIIIFLFVAFEFIIVALSFGIRLFYTNGKTFKEAVSDNGLKLFLSLLLFSAVLHIPSLALTITEYFLKKEVSFPMLVILFASIIILACAVFCMEG